MSLILLILIAAASGSEPTLTPQAGVLVLRNGQILRGEITSAGDYFVVVLGPASEIRMPATDVDISCRTLDEAYLWKLQRLDATDVIERITLAEWCLRHGLLAQASEQAELAQEQASGHPRLKILQDRLTLSREKPPEPSPVKATANIATIAAEQLDQAARELPSGSVEKFAAVVQPIVLNRCGANQCHGPTSKNDFQLLRPAVGQVANRRFSQRNLYSILQFVDREEPLNSPLLLMPQKRHGGTAGPVFDERTRNQLEELTGWVLLTTAVPKAVAAPQTIDPMGALATPAGNPTTHAQAGDARNTVAHTPRPIDGSAPPKTGTLPAPEPPAAVHERFRPRDAFDPEIFNRQFFGGK